MKGLIHRLKRVKSAIPGCESLTVASSDGFILATTHDERRKGEFLAAVTSVLLHSINKGFAPYEAGDLRNLDFRGQRQLLLLRLKKVKAFLILVLKPGAHPISLDDPVLREVTITAPAALSGDKPASPVLFYLERDEGCWLPIRSHGTLIGRAVSCDVMINNPKLDKRHVLIEIHGNVIYLRDLESKEGTRLNGRRLRGSIELEPGDRFTIPGAGGYTLISIDERGKISGQSKTKTKAAKKKTAKKKAAKKKPSKTKAAKKKPSKTKASKTKAAKKKPSKTKTSKTKTSKTKTSKKKASRKKAAKKKPSKKKAAKKKPSKKKAAKKKPSKKKAAKKKPSKKKTSKKTAART